MEHFLIFIVLFIVVLSQIECVKIKNSEIPLEFPLNKGGVRVSLLK
jgi:hypothetical protein